MSVFQFSDRCGFQTEKVRKGAGWLGLRQGRTQGEVGVNPPLELDILQIYYSPVLTRCLIFLQ